MNTHGYNNDGDNDNYTGNVNKAKTRTIIIKLIRFRKLLLYAVLVIAVLHYNSRCMVVASLDNVCQNVDFPLWLLK